MRLGAVVILVAPLGLLHRGIAFLLAVPGRRGSRDDGGINNRASGNANTFAVQIPIHRIEELAAKIVLFKQVAKVQNGALVGRRVELAEIATK